eukprot:TRINITY_DN1315_c0_g1_i6.p1 TRINITY_DN1315_c0_g1~~TRINITY_DN1315_c0_g1_i6.p1  ORF type:complete len:115 (-),score=13.34 TRINITY_DN1315_c0_g1_i6:136-480(-)
MASSVHTEAERETEAPAESAVSSVPSDTSTQSQEPPLASGTTPALPRHRIRKFIQTPQTTAKRARKRKNVEPPTPAPVPVYQMPCPWRKSFWTCSKSKVCVCQAYRPTEERGGG